ncbi:30S ribosomal protein S12 methylthiotransferase RimO [uncultured Slackia sp.]|uniref:30S ribosomal protein S12 methylthiotransferase RimO n=1 Tax=uncultured Slackia sp. TaxID=665903 RepID=UPI0025E80C19|nr:30S ribosomal protein S12 methylthiotransferase RimO [uncultured Slackia sp.]
MSNIDVTTAHCVSSAPSVCFVTLGCAKNEVDTAEMTKRVTAAGFSVVDDPGAADAVVVNTCSFIQAATEESIECIFDICGLENFESGRAKLVVAGCMPARYGTDLEGELAEASAFVPCSKEDDIADVLRELLGFKGASSATRAVSPYAASPASYVKISDGCDRFCSFCAIPYIRGAYHSFPYEDVRAAVAERVAAGVREITLIAQDTGRWGEDFDDADTTAHLLDRLADEFSDTWFRLMYIEPQGVTDELLDVIAARPNICSYLDVPLQHASKKILRSMNRRGDAQKHLDLVARMRERVPGITLRTTLIAGFPGETDEDFEELISFLEEAEFDYAGVFPYSAEEGTRAATLPDQVDEDVKIARAQEVRDLADSIGEAHVSQRIGQEMDVLVLGREEDGQLYGRAMCQAPEVDGVVYLEEGEPGDIVRVKITDTLVYEMEGDIIYD